MEPAQPPAPVMDVLPRHSPTHAAGSLPEQLAVKPAPPVEDTDPPESKTLPAKINKDQPKSQAKQPGVAKNLNKGVGMAIFATVIIVLGLAALATYAFLKTQN